MPAIITSLPSSRIALAALCATVIACGAAPPPSRPYAGRLPPNTHVDLAGTFTFSPAGELSLALAHSCVTGPAVPAYGAALYQPSASDHDCDATRLGLVHVVATTPWHTQVRGVWTDASHLAFRVDWAQSGLDPLADDAATLVTQPWAISGAQWTPTAAEGDRILHLVGNATQTEPDLVRGGQAPSLEVASFEVAEGSLHAGGDATLVVKIANRGPGIAYRVVATTRSSVASLHGQRLGFGMIKPGAEKIRKLRVSVPTSETSPDTMLVLVLAEGNGFTPHNTSHRVPIAASTNAPVLAVRCTIPSRPAAHPDLDAGESVAVRCVVDNTGGAAAKIELETAVGRATPARSPSRDLAIGGHASFDVPVTIPRDLAIDAPVEIAVTARDTVSARTARTSLTGTVRKPKLCTAGQLTRAQYRAKIAELRSAVQAGDLTQAQFDRYDAELVTCLQ